MEAATAARPTSKTCGRSLTRGGRRMARGKMIVEWAPEDTNRLPDELSSSATVLLKFRSEGFLEEAAKQLKVRRQGGYSGMALWVALVIYMASRSVRGIRPSWESWGGKALGNLAAIGGLRSCPSAGSLSRGLSAGAHPPWRMSTPRGVAEQMTLGIFSDPPSEPSLKWIQTLLNSSSGGLLPEKIRRCGMEEGPFQATSSMADEHPLRLRHRLKLRLGS